MTENKNMTELTKPLEDVTSLYNDVCDIIDKAKTNIAVYANAQICMTNWYIGKRIKEDVLKNERAEYGKEVVVNLSAKLTKKYGKGWSTKNLHHCLRSAEIFTEEEIVYAVRRQLSWTQVRSLSYVKEPLARQFYLEMAAIEHWNTRTLDEKIDGQLYERTAISRRPDKLIKEELSEAGEKNQLVPDMVFKSTYFLDMLGLPDVFKESDLEKAIISQMEAFLMELGTDFAFLARQKRIPVDNVDYHLDLLFFHRELKRMVAIDLKIGKFKPEYEGQMRLYLRYLDKKERKAGEESPIGLILCSEGNTEHIEYLMLDENNPVKVAQYYTKLPDKKVLALQMRKAIETAKALATDASGEKL